MCSKTQNLPASLSDSLKRSWKWSPGVSLFLLVCLSVVARGVTVMRELLGEAQKSWVMSGLWNRLRSSAVQLSLQKDKSLMQEAWLSSSPRWGKTLPILPNCGPCSSSESLLESELLSSSLESPGRGEGFLPFPGDLLSPSYMPGGSSVLCLLY
jgi:hypothetical protein